MIESKNVRITFSSKKKKNIYIYIYIKWGLPIIHSLVSNKSEFCIPDRVTYMLLLSFTFVVVVVVVVAI